MNDVRVCSSVDLLELAFAHFTAPPPTRPELPSRTYRTMMYLVSALSAFLPAGPAKPGAWPDPACYLEGVHHRIHAPQLVAFPLRRRRRGKALLVI